MAQNEQKRLDTGDKFPNMPFTTITGRNLNFPDEFVGEWKLVLFYRGGW